VNIFHDILATTALGGLAQTVTRLLTPSAPTGV